ncbi:unnamed protein product [Adineta ricciae]|uniref:Uncharacterized protein n=1 Tax=Adineta ricciae TaxID=249248 RepID=A0A814L7H8_ADIRI|nr:unnamed protein product [Adineta ricciae]
MVPRQRTNRSPSTTSLVIDLTDFPEPPPPAPPSRSIENVLVPETEEERNQIARITASRATGSSSLDCHSFNRQYCSIACMAYN